MLAETKSEERPKAFAKFREALRVEHDDRWQWQYRFASKLKEQVLKEDDAALRAEAIALFEESRKKAPSSDQAWFERQLRELKDRK